MLKKLIPEFSIFFAYLICFLITDRILFPIQIELFESKPLLSAALIFLPHGVRVISTVVYGLRSLIPLFCAHVLAGLSFISDAYLLIPLSLVSTLCVWLSIHMIYRRINGLSLEQITFKNIILIAFLSSILNSIGNYLTKIVLIDDYGTLFNQELFLYVLGDFLGTILLFLLYVKWLKKYLMKFFAEKHQ